MESENTRAHSSSSSDLEQGSVTPAASSYDLSVAPPPHLGNDAYATAPTSYSGKKLYDPTTAGIAAFLGGPIAGAILIALNYRQMGKLAEATQAIVGGVVLTGALLGIGYVMPESISGFRIGLSIAVLMTIVHWMRSGQGAAIEEHRAAGGKIASRWSGVGIGLLCGIVLVALIFAVVLVWYFLNP